MKNILLYTISGFNIFIGAAQSTKVELYELVKKLVSDSTGYENVGDWAVDQSKKFPVKWYLVGQCKPASHIYAV